MIMGKTPLTCEVLVSHGYRETDHLHYGEGGYPLEAKYYSFVGQDGLVRVDVQWMIVDSHFSFHLDHEDWRAGLIPVSMTGTPVSIFPPDVVLLILCVHRSTSGRNCNGFVMSPNCSAPIRSWIGSESTAMPVGSVVTVCWRWESLRP